MIDQHDVSIPADASPVECRFCGRPFSTESRRILHEGLDHYERLDDATRRAFADAYEAEQEAIRVFRVKALGALVVLYFGFLWAYSILG